MLHAIALAAAFAALQRSDSSPDRAALATKLAQAIASDQRFMQSKVYVGALPPGAALRAPLPDYPILGSVVQTASNARLGSEPTTTVYYEAADANRALAVYQKRLVSAGWRPFRLFDALEQQHSGGFDVSGAGAPMPGMYCEPNGGVAATTRVYGMSGVFAVAFGAGRQGVAMCAMNAAFSATPSPPPLPPIPTLRAPANVTMESAGASISVRSESNSDALLTTASPIGSVGAAFAQQVISAHWAADAPAQSTSAYVQTFHSMSNGRHYQAVLTLITAGKTQQYDASFRVRDLDDTTPNGFSFPGFP